MEVQTLKLSELVQGLSVKSFSLNKQFCLIFFSIKKAVNKDSANVELFCLTAG